MSCDLRAVAGQIRPFVERRVAPHDVDDVMQEILHRAHTGVDALDDDTRFAAWLHRVARNAISDHHRRRGRRDAKHDAFAAEWHDEVAEQEDAVASLSVFVRAFVDMLPSPYREALQLTEIDGLTMREAAEREGISVSGMKSRVQRGRRLLRELFEACCEIALDARGRVVEYTPRR
ncbi:MAG: sigma-70 family RNA polymerase sigma factor [Kofleriaceae bacterium]|nr:MAG: sigma-70 family RNA polymerase sigma factor [Kofleriaceae bacterium]MBZ0231038.1 sigma-70 family RNA polymerase sigma factor [Kofleriaceae bacterium]